MPMVIARPKIIINLAITKCISFRCAGEAKDPRPATTHRRDDPVLDCSGASVNFEILIDWPSSCWYAGFMR